jgi:signal recognition particle GTPase
MNNTIEMGYRIEHLTKHEINKLSKMILGYGNFKRIASGSGMHPNTFRNILDKGYGTPDNIQKIRQNILNPVL